MASVYSVAQVNSYIKNMFTQDFMLTHLFIRGEVSNCKYHTSGHIYFTIKDETGTMACVMFAGNRKGLTFTMREGQKVIVEGSVSIYERDGKYQLYAKTITLDGTGLLYQKYEALKQELEEMGMFSEEYKKPIPRFATKVGVVTASTGAAIQDIINISSRRNPFVQLILYPALVQGDEAKESIVKGIEYLDDLGLDVLIVGRGGGSIEDLWAFNEECVARAIFASRTPVISAVGHEVDVTIADYVADLRAPTPSAAAELAVFDYQAFLNTLADEKQLLMQKMQSKTQRVRSTAEQIALRLRYVSPQNKLLEKRQRLLDMEERLEAGMDRKLTRRRHSVAIYAERLEGLSPLKKLSQGYSYVTDAKGKNIKTVSKVKPGDRLMIRVTDGSLETQVREVDRLQAE